MFWGANGFPQGGRLLVRCLQHAGPAPGKHQRLGGVQHGQRAGIEAALHPLLHAVVAEALHSVGAQQIDIRVGGRHAKRLPGGNFRHGSQVFIQRDQAVAAAHIQQQRGLAAARCGTLQRGTAKIIPRGLGAGAGVQHGNVGVKHRHDAALALPVQPQQHTPLLAV